MKRKFTSLLFLAMFIVPAMATYVWLQQHKSGVRRAVKHQIEEGLDRDELVLLKFSRKDAQQQLRWEHAKEFEYQEEMYDVVEKEEVGDSLYYWCWWDHKETKLNRQLAEWVTRILHANPERNACQDRLVTYFQSLYCSVAASWQTGLENRCLIHAEREVRTVSLLTNAPPSPPPLV